VAHLILVLGPRGTGRSTSLTALAELGFATADTTGPQVETLLSTSGPGPDRLAVTVELELPEVIETLPARIGEARRAGHTVEVLLLDADDPTLLRRSVIAPELAEYGIEDAGLGDIRDRLATLRPLARACVDTTELAPEELAVVVKRVFGPAGAIGETD